MAALFWAIPAALALGLLAVREPRNASTVLLEAAIAWTALTLLALPIIIARS